MYIFLLLNERKIKLKKNSQKKLYKEMVEILIEYAYYRIFM